MTAKFTKGPWVSNGCSCVSAGSKVLCAFTGNAVVTGDVTEDYANAHLTASAPEMYEMLDSLLQNSSFNANFPEEAERIETLLAKARGEV